MIFAQRLIGSVVRAGQTAVRIPLLRGAVAISQRTEVQGFEVADLRVGRSDSALLERVAEIIRFVIHTDPKRARRMQQDVQRVVLMDLGGVGGSYLAEINACALDPYQVQQQPVEATALILVHEATHARIQKAGIRYNIPMRDRIEAICVNEEIAFAERFANGAGYIASARRALEHPWWSVGDEQKREERQLRALGWPEWMIKLRNFFQPH
jgi:hypothetical protein